MSIRGGTAPISRTPAERAGQLLMRLQLQPDLGTSPTSAALILRVCAPAARPSMGCGGLRFEMMGYGWIVSYTLTSSVKIAVFHSDLASFSWRNADHVHNADSRLFPARAVTLHTSRARRERMPPIAG